MLAVNDEPAEQVSDLDQEVVQHLGHVDIDACHDNHFLQIFSVCGVLIIQEAVEVSAGVTPSASLKPGQISFSTMRE